MKAKWILIGVLVALASALSVVVWSQDAGGPPPGAPPAQAGPEVGLQWKWMARLTPEQRQQVQDKVQGLRQQGKSEAEIRAAITEMLKGWGVKVPGLGAAGAGKWLAQLTPEQRAQVLAKAREMKAEGKTPQEIRAALAEILRGWGIELPPAGGPGLGRGWLGQLTAVQRQQVTARVKELREQGKTPQEIRAAVVEMLKGWGIEPPAPGLGLGGAKAQLTPEQRDQVMAKIKEMKEQGKAPEEIRAAVAEMLKGWGIEAPQGRPGLGKGLLGQLTPEQRQQVAAKIKELREQGKTPREIHAAVLEMLRGWGIEPPTGTPRLRPGRSQPATPAGGQLAA